MGTQTTVGGPPTIIGRPQTIIGGSYQMIREHVPIVTWPRDIRYGLTWLMIRASKSHQHGDIAASTIAISMLYKNRNKSCHAGHKHKSKRGSLPHLGDFLFRRSDSVGIQTQDLQNRNLTLYSAKLRSHNCDAKLQLSFEMCKIPIIYLQRRTDCQYISHNYRQNDKI